MSMRTYATREYGATDSELNHFEQRTHGQIEKARKKGKLHDFTGDIEALLEDSPRHPRFYGLASFLPIPPLLWLQLAFAMLILATPVLGELPAPPFCMDYAADRATSIVIGSLHPDGSLSVIRTIKGPHVNEATYNFLELNSYLEIVRKALDGTPDPRIVAFLDNPPKADSPTPALYDLIGFSANADVYGCFPAMTLSGVQFKAHESWKQGQFLVQLNRSLLKSEKARWISTDSPSAEKVEKMFSFLRESVNWPEISEQQNEFYFNAGSGYWIAKCLNGFTLPPTPGEELALRTQLEHATSDREIAMTLFMIGRLPCSKNLYATVLPYVDASKSGEIRRQAFGALKTIDEYPASEVLSKFIRHDEPELKTLLRTLRRYGIYGERPSLLNITLVGPSIRLAEMNLAAERSSNVSAFSGDDTADVLDLLTSINHPSFLPLVIEWAGDPAAKSSRYASGRLEWMLGIEHEKFDLAAVRDWWRNAEPVLSRAYDLRSPTGLAEWLKAWSSSVDPLTQRMLSRLWDFQEVIPEEHLLAACEGEHSNAAKALLSDLWEKKRLSPGTRMSLVKAYLKIRLVEDTASNPALASAKSIWLKYDVQFPFPKAAWMDWGADISNCREPSLGDGHLGNGSSLHDYPKSPVEVSKSVLPPTKALVEMREYTGLKPRTWKLRWELNSSKPDSGTAKKVNDP